MARAQGANALLNLAFETAYGSVPGTGFKKVPFVSASLGEQQNLIDSDLLGYGREPQVPARDVINNDGDVVVPLDLRNIGYWLKLLMGAPVVTAGVAASGTITFSAQPATSSTITIGGTAFTFVAANPTGNQILIGATLADTLKNVVIALKASAVGAISAQDYALDLTATIITITSRTVGTAGNSVTLAAGSAPASNGTVSGATLSGGSATGPSNNVFNSGSLALPSASVEVGMPDVPSYGMNFGLMADKMAIQLQRSGMLNATVSCIAQGENRASSSGAGSPTTQIIERFTQFAGLIKRDGVPLGNIVSGTFNYANNLDKVEVIRPDGRIGGIDPAQIVVDGQIVVRFADTDLLNLAINNTPLELVFNWQITAAKSLTILVPTVYLPRPRIAVTGPGAVQATFDYNGAQNATSGRSCVITLVNDISTY
jgi:hypothetical protein